MYNILNKRAGIIVVFFLSGLLVSAQDIDYARFCLEKLTSKSFHGRGYVKDGDHKAAKFISRELEKNDLKYFDENYFQSYNFPVNTFPDKVEVTIGKDKLIPGKDYVISSSNISTNDTFKLVFVPDSIITDSLFLDYIAKQNYSEDDVIVTSAGLRSIYGKELEGIRGVVVKVDKPWWHVSKSTELSNTLWIKIKKESFNTRPNSITVNFENILINSHQTQNVIAFVEGKKYPDKYFVFTAHYDHLGMMGNKTYFPGANDNASGTSMLLDLARHYSIKENQPDYSIAFMAFSGEEVGLFGSKFYAENPLFPLDSIELLINLDMVGTGSEGITVVNSSVYGHLLEEMRRINEENGYLKQIKQRGESCNSDHCPFYEKGVKSVFIYTMGPEHMEYHTIYDNAENFPFTAYNDLFRLLNELVKDYSKN